MDERIKEAFEQVQAESGLKNRGLPEKRNGKI